MSIDLKALREATVATAKWQAAGCPVEDEHDTYPDEILSMYTSPAGLLDLLDRLEAAERRAEEAEKECAQQARLVGMGAERELALMAQVAETEKERDTMMVEATRAALMEAVHRHRKAALDEWYQKTEFVQDQIAVGLLPVKYLGWHRADVLRDLVAERDALLKDAESWRRWIRWCERDDAELAKEFGK